MKLQVDNIAVVAIGIVTVLAGGEQTLSSLLHHNLKSELKFINICKGFPHG